jgi:5-methylcytosine-specific restriction endonuclease McrA
VCGHDKDLNVHHIKPFHEFPELELVDANLITLCEGVLRGRDHLRFGHLGNWKISNPNVRADADANYSATHPPK